MTFSYRNSTKSPVNTDILSNHRSRFAKKDPDQTLSKKVRIFKDSYQENVNHYQINRRSLGFLPKLFIVFMTVLFIAGGFWYIGIFDIFSFNSPIQNVNETREVQPLNTLNDQELSKDEGSNLEQDLLNPIPPGAIELVSKNNISCYFQFNPNQPAQINPIFSSTPQGWWVPASCSLPVDAIQIVRMDGEQSKLLAKQPQISNKIQNIDDIDTFAIEYNDGTESLFTLNKHVKTLTSPVFNDRFYFSTASVHSELRIGRKTYYLDGNCQNGGSDPCKLWEWDNFSGKAVLKKKNVGDSAPGQANEIKRGYTLNFSRKQDYDNGINLILYDENKQNVRLIRVTLNSELIPVTSTLDMTPEHPSYRLYV